MTPEERELMRNILRHLNTVIRGFGAIFAALTEYLAKFPDSKKTNSDPPKS